MKKFALILIMFCVTGQILNAQNKNESEEKGSQTVVYSGLFNMVPGDFKYPLLGLVNIANGDYQGAEIGLINQVNGNFKGAQLGLTNTASGTVDGTQVGLVNTTPKNMTGPQLGLVNTTGGSMIGPQVGLVNTVIGEMKTAQIGLVNVSAKTMPQAQVGLMNTTNKLNGVQVGLINFAKNAENGTPIGLISIVGKGGYYAVEAYTNETAEANLALKLGVSHMHSSVGVSLKPDEELYGLSLGLGSILPIANKFYFNPEVNVSSFLDEPSITSTLGINFGFAITNHLHIVAGPSFGVETNNEGEEVFIPEVYKLKHFEIDDSVRGILGAKIGIRYNITDWK
jgi:hypothetical protein